MGAEKTTTSDTSSPEQLVALATELAGEIRQLMRTDFTQAQDKLDHLENTDPVLFFMVKRRLY